MAETPITVDISTPVGATATVSEIDSVESEYDRLQKLIAQTQRKIKARMDQLGVWAPDTPQYQKALRESNTAKKELADLREKAAPLKKQIDDYNAKRQQEQDASRQRAATERAAAEGEKVVSSAKKELDNATANLERVRRRAEEQNWTKAATDRAISAAQARVDKAKSVYDRVSAPPTFASDAATLIEPGVETAAAGTDFTHNVKLNPGQVLWREKGNWVAKDQSYFFGANTYIRPERIAEVRKALQDAGFDAGKSLPELTSNFRELLTQANAGGYSPLEAAKWNAEYGFGGAQDGGVTGGPRVYETVRLQDPRALQQTINQVWKTYLKRDATWNEITEITKLVNKEIKENPVTTVQTAGGTTVSGFDSDSIGAFIINQAKRRPEFKQQQGEDFELWIDSNANGIKFASLVSDPGLDAVRRLYMAGNETDALRALKKLGTVAKAEASGIAGATAKTQQSLNAYAQAMGVAFDSAAAAKAIVEKMASEDDYRNQIRELAKSYYPAWSKQLDAGQTMQQIAYPYLNSMSTILELNPSDVNVNDPLVKKALSFRDKEGNAASQSIWDFEQSLRSDPRWAYTKNARNELDSVARSVLRDFGLAY